MSDPYVSAVNRANALSRWDKTGDRRAATQSMRDGFRAKLRAQVLEENPGLTDPAEIENRAQRKLKIHLERMRASSLKTRRARSTAERLAAENDRLAEIIIETATP